ncbi:hypothetical protein SNEBB_009216 [Seison nebaliae]|nr:hypothetical protein SNEBB_009216 [Seison nebaliae]
MEEELIEFIFRNKDNLISHVRMDSEIANIVPTNKKYKIKFPLTKNIHNYFNVKKNDFHRLDNLNVFTIYGVKFANRKEKLLNKLENFVEDEREKIEEAHNEKLKSFILEATYPDGVPSSTQKGQKLKILINFLLPKKSQLVHQLQKLRSSIKRSKNSTLRKSNLLSILSKLHIKDEVNTELLNRMKVNTMDNHCNHVTIRAENEKYESNDVANEIFKLDVVKVEDDGHINRLRERMHVDVIKSDMNGIYIKCNNDKSRARLSVKSEPEVQKRRIHKYDNLSRCT